MKVPLAVFFVLALVTAGTATICLSGAVTTRTTEYGTVNAVFHDWLGRPVRRAPVRHSFVVFDKTHHTASIPLRRSTLDHGRWLSV